MTIEQIKEQLQRLIDLSDKATPGPWTLDNMGSNGPHAEVWDVLVGARICSGIFPRNADLIALSRNISPSMARALLVTIGHLEFLEPLPGDASSFVLGDIVQIFEP